jgi:glucokinase
MINYCFGVDLGGTSIKFGILDINKDELIEKWSNETSKIKTNKDFQLLIENEYKKFSSRYPLKKVIVIGVPGPVNPLINSVDILPNIIWDTYKPEDFSLKDNTKVKIILHNDANLAAFGEYWKRKKLFSSETSLALVTIGTGLGCGLIMNDEIITGTSGYAGELGHLYIPNKYNFKCKCGNIGCLETICSAQGLRNILNYLYETKVDSSDYEQLINSSAEELFAIANDGHPVASEVIDIFIKTLGIALVNICSVINPSIILIGGGISLSFNNFSDKLQQSFKVHAMANVKNTPIKQAILAEQAGIYGACYYGNKINL